MPHFSKTLVSVRARAGFKTAYAFYHDNGGRRVFPFTYAYYAKVERGQSLPRPEWALLLIQTLRLIGSAQKAQLVHDYLKDLSGRAFRDLFEPFLSLPGEETQHAALRSLRGRLAVHVTPGQFAGICATMQSAACFNILVSTGEGLDASELAGLLRSPLKSVQDALESLRSERLVKRTADGRYMIRNVGGYYSMPEDAESKKLSERMQYHLAELSRRCGAQRFSAWTSLRMSPKVFESSIESLRNSFQVIAGQAAHIPPKADDAPLYLVEARVRSVVGFKRS